MEKCFLVFFFLQNVFFFLNHAGESQVLQILIAISEFAIQLSSGLKIIM